MGYNFLDKKTESKITENEQLAEELYRSVIKNLKKTKSMQEVKAIFGKEI